MDKTKSPATKLLRHIYDKVGKQNIPCLAIVGDRISKRTGVVMDNRKEMREINVTLLLDAMLNQPKEIANELVNVVLGASAILCAEVDGIYEMFDKRVKEVKASQEQVTLNIAEA